MLEACSLSPTHSSVSNVDTNGTTAGMTVEDKDEESVSNGVSGMSLEEPVDELKQ